MFKDTRRIKNKAGRTVEIFRDPVTQTESEGCAVLIKYITGNGTLEKWLVRFLGLKENVQRWIEVRS